MEPTAQDIAFAADVRRRDAALHAWMGKRNSYHPDEVPETLKPLPTDEERSRAEVIEFLAQPLEYGKSYGAYLKDCGKVQHPACIEKRQVWKITTFTGDTLAFVTRIKSSRQLFKRNTFSDQRGSFWARGIDGRLYYGRHNGAGMYCTLRLAKVQS